MGGNEKLNGTHNEVQLDGVAARKKLAGKKIDHYYEDEYGFPRPLR